MKKPTCFTCPYRGFMSYCTCKESPKYARATWDEDCCEQHPERKEA